MIYAPWVLHPPPKPPKRRDPYDSSTWGPVCARGIEYHQTGAPVAAGTPGVIRKLGTTRKARGMASDHIGKVEVVK
jgi:hypothetical protein